MFVRKYTKDTKLEDGEKVLTGAKNVNIRDGAGLKNEIRVGTKYIVSGDYLDFFEPVVERQPKHKAAKPDKEVD